MAARLPGQASAPPSLQTGGLPSIENLAPPGGTSKAQSSAQASPSPSWQTTAPNAPQAYRQRPDQTNISQQAASEAGQLRGSLNNRAVGEPPAQEQQASARVWSEPETVSDQSAARADRWSKLAGSASSGQSGDLILPADPPRDPALMAFLSGCCMPGLGQMILGQTMKGAILSFIAVILWCITGGAALLLLLPLSAIDSYLIAEKLKNGKAVGHWGFF